MSYNILEPSKSKDFSVYSYLDQTVLSLRRETGQLRNFASHKQFPVSQNQNRRQDAKIQNWTPSELRTLC